MSSSYRFWTPQLTVVAAAAGNIKKLSGILWANVKKVSSIVETSIKKVSGVTAN